MDLSPESSRVSSTKRTHKRRRLISVETEYELLKVVIFSLLGLVATLSLISSYPHLGALIASYNQF